MGRGSICEAIFIGMASLLTLLTIVFLMTWVLRLLAIEASHNKADLVASKAAHAVTAGLHSEPIPESDTPNGTHTALFQRIDDAIRGEPTVIKIRKFGFVGNLPVEITDPRKKQHYKPSTLEHDVVRKLLAGVQFATHISASWFTPPDHITAYAPVYNIDGTIHGAVAVDLEPVALRARLKLLHMTAIAACIAAFLFSALLALRIIVNNKLLADAALRLKQSRQFEILTIEALGELLYSVDIASGKITWRREKEDHFMDRIQTPPDTIEAWEQWIHPEDRKKFHAAHSAALAEGDKISLEYRILLPGQSVSLWILDRATLMEDSTGARILVGALVDISARKTSDALLREFIDQTPTAQFVFDGDTIISANPAAGEMMGASKNDVLISRPLWTLWPKLQKDGAISAEAWSRHVVAAIESGTQHFEWLFLRFDETTLTVDVFLKSAILDSRAVILMACHDLTEVKRTQSMLEESERRFRDVTESVGEFVWEVDDAGRYTYASRRVVDILGVSPEQAIGHCPLEWVVEEDKLLVLKRSTEIENLGEPFRDFTHRIRRNDGEIRWIRVSGIPRFSISGKLMGYRGITLDITQQRQYEDELLLQKEAAEAADRAKSSFLAMMSHEIRTPLNSVLGFTEILLESSLTDSQRESLETIRSSGDALLHLLNDILDFSKIESDRLEIDLQPTNLRDCLRDSIELQQPSAKAKGLEIRTYVDALIPEWMASDPVRLKQILLNLIANAVKFTSQGYVSVNITGNESSDSSETSIEIRIEDTGIGIQPQQIERLFKPFSQADSSTSRQYGGSGLGLVISQRLANLLNGDLRLESTSDNGTIFVVHLPCIPTSAPTNTIDLASEFSFLFPGPKILVVDDNPINRRLTQRILGQFGATVETVESGSECLEKIASASYDVILMDVQMPGMDGHETTQRLRVLEAEYGLSRTPVVALTADAMRGDREKCLEAGMDEYLTKPIQRSVLVETLARLLPGRFINSIN